MTLPTAVLLALIAPSVVAAPDLAGLSASLQGRLARAQSPELRWPDWSDYRAPVHEIYKRLEGRLAWFQGGVPTPQARDLALILAGAEQKGLNATDYDGDRWTGKLAALTGGTGPALEAEDVAFTVCVLRYLSDLRLGRINPARLEQGTGGTARRRFLAGAVVDLVTAPNPGANLDQLEPAHAGYRALIAQLPRYAELAKRPAKTFHPSRNLAPGGVFPDAQALAELLVALGDLGPEEAKALPVGQYDPVLAAAVGRFQGRHGLEAKGKLGSKTVAELNVPLSRRLTQLRLTLERWRWAEFAPAPRMIQVNIPGFYLSALSAQDGGYRTDLWMRVVVGKAVHHETNLLTGKVEAVVFRPTWDVPQTIVQKDILPQLRRNPALLDREGYGIVSGAGQPVAATAGAIKGLAAGRNRIVQAPGPRNALGHVKFLFSNPFLLYLHDTPSRGAFASSRRDFSHGCVRLEHPADLAAWVLQDLPDWNPEKIKAEMAADGQPLIVPVKAPIQVMILYATATVDGAGKVYFYDDIYGNDKDLAKALAGGYPYPW